MVPAYSVKVPRVSTYSGYRHVNSPFAYGAFTLSGRLSQNRSARLSESIPRSEPQDARTLVWALPISLAATFGITCCFLFLRLLRCFSSPGSPCIPMDSVCSDGGPLRRVSPFRYLRINGYLLLPEAFRSLSRLSSALSAKASTIRSFMHDQRDLKDGFFQVHTCIALHALVFGQFFCFVFFKVCNHYTVSCYNNYLGCLDQDILIFSISYMRFSRYIAKQIFYALEACFHKL